MSLVDRVKTFLAREDLDAATRELLRSLTAMRRSDPITDDTDIEDLLVAVQGQMRRVRSLNEDKAASRIDPRDARESEARLSYDILRTAEEISARREKAHASGPGPRLTVTAPGDVRAAIEQMRPERSFGRQNLKAIGWLRRGLEISTAVCRIVVEADDQHVFYGTGFVVPGGWMMTAAHLFTDDGKPSPVQRDLIKRTYVQFGYDDELNDLPRDVVQYRLDADSVAVPANPALDCLLVRIQDDPINGTVQAGNWGKTDITDARVRPQEFVPIIQHANGGAKQIAITGNEVITNKGDQIWYTTDTESGSSGAPVFNEDWRVVAIHIGTLDKPVKESPIGRGIYANVGIPMRYVLEDSTLGKLLRK